MKLLNYRVEEHCLHIWLRWNLDLIPLYRIEEELLHMDISNLCREITEERTTIM